jgi:hypothetical protein
VNSAVDSIASAVMIGFFMGFLCSIGLLRLASRGVRERSTVAPRRREVPTKRLISGEESVASP